MTRWNYQSNVADVLSLGPRTAGRLLQLGVRTAADLLAAKPQALARRLNDEKLSTETIVAWQGETQLLLELPELGADAARVLAAIGFASSDAIARTTPTELLAQWETSCRAQPERSWLSQSPRPSVGEVNLWIRYAQQTPLQRVA